jgi:hypothetical protein
MTVFVNAISSLGLILGGLIALTLATLAPAFSIPEEEGTFPAVPVPLVHPPSGTANKEAALAVLHAALHEAVWGGPAQSEVRQEIELNGQRSTGFGDFVRGGQGSGRLRMNIRLAAGNQFHHLIQVCDGELMYSHEELGNTSRRTRVDLGRVRERLVITSDSLNDPVIAMYLAIGGQAELLRKLSQQYEWTGLRPGDVAGEPVWWLVGKLAEQPVAVRAHADIDTLTPDAFGFRPRDVQVAIGRENSAMPFWLFEVRQSRSTDASSPPDYSTDLTVKIEFPNPQKLAAAQLTPELFEFQLNNEPFVDETKKYLAPPTAFSSQGAAGAGLFVR